MKTGRNLGKAGRAVGHEANVTRSEGGREARWSGSIRHEVPSKAGLAGAAGNPESKLTIRGKLCLPVIGVC